MVAKRGNAFKDLTGKRFGRLIAISYDIRPSGPSGQPKTFWMCKCDCGNIKEIMASQLMTGKTISCGCYHKEVTKMIKTKHGCHGMRIYNIWGKMLARVQNPKNNEYHNYGARGITVCERWLNFQNFKEDMYEKYLKHVQDHGKKNTTIERIDNNKGYEPSNCKWVTLAEQGLNKRNNKRYLINGEPLTVREISVKYNISINTLIMRIKKGCPIEKLATPPTESHSRRAKECS